jgi:SOS response associated peptidase (SRAP)
MECGHRNRVRTCCVRAGHSSLTASTAVRRRLEQESYDTTTMRMVLSTPVIVSMLIALSSMFTAAAPGSAAAPQVRTQAPVWFAFNESRPLAFFAGIWTRWTSVRKVREGETTNDLFAFLTTEPNKVVGAIHPKAMPVILTTAEEIDLWMTGPPEVTCRRRADDRCQGREDR